MSFFGKVFSFDREENFDAFVQVLDTSESVRTGFKNFRPSHSLLKNEDGTYTFKTISPTVNRSLTFKLGDEVEETFPDGSKGKSVFTLDGNVLTQILTVANGSSMIYTREFSDNEIKGTYKTSDSDVVGIRYYKASS